jgi:hypothetical protein
MKMPIRCPETSVNNYHTTPHNIPEERRSPFNLLNTTEKLQSENLLPVTSTVSGIYEPVSTSRAADILFFGWLHTSRLPQPTGVFLVSSLGWALDQIAKLAVTGRQKRQAVISHDTT